MEDWFGILLFLFFFVILPLLQGISQRRKRKHGEMEEEPWDPEPTARPARRGIEPADWNEAGEARELAGQRSAWDDLNLDDLFREPAPGSGPEPRSEPSMAPAPRAEPRATPVPAPSPTPSRSARWEAPEPRAERPAPVVRAEREAPVVRAERAAPVVRAERAVPVPRSTDRQSISRRPPLPIERIGREPRHRRGGGSGTLLPDLHDADEIRRAIVVAEVLGPPRSMQEYEVRQ